MSMEDARPTTKTSASPVVAAALILLLLAAPLLYLLSTGPAVWLVQNGFLSSEWVEGIYAPVSYCVQHSPWCEAAMRWYLGFFIDI